MNKKMMQNLKNLFIACSDHSFGKFHADILTKAVHAQVPESATFAFMSLVLFITAKCLELPQYTQKGETQGSSVSYPGEFDNEQLLNRGIQAARTVQLTWL